MTDRRSARAGAHRASSGRGRKLGLVLAAALVAVACLVAGFALWPDDPSASTDEPANLPGAGAREDLVEWTGTELPADTPVAVPAALRTVLLEAGEDPARFVTSASGALQVVDGTPPAGAVVLASFEDPVGEVLLVVDPAPGVPTPEETDRRARLAAAVLANPGTGAEGDAAEVLRTADLDARLLSLLSVLVAQFDVRVADFPAAPAEPADGPPARRVLLDRSGPDRLTPGSPAADRLTTFLAAQLPPFAPDTVEVTADGLLIGFRYASAPDAMVTSRTP